MKGCPACGQTLPEKLPLGLCFRGIKKRIVDVVHRAGETGIPTDALFDRIYGEDPNGGPETGFKIIAVHVCAMNKKMKPFGLKISSKTVGRGGCGAYVISKIKEAAQ
jgi:hypothetical protein